MIPSMMRVLMVGRMIGVPNKFIHSLLKVKHGEENANFRKPIRIEDDAIRYRGIWKKRMEDSERWRTVGCFEAGQSIKDVALFFGVHHSIISRLWKQFQITQTVVRRPIGGRPRVTTPAENQYIATVAKRNYRATSTRVTSMVTASIGARLKWCRKHGNWTVSNWGNVLFTDESRFSLEPDDKRIRIWRKQGTRNYPETSPNITHSEAEALWCRQGFH
ncbi:HTH_Tnp_Tc3_2 domain-containing protein [Trichonephila clavipes]|uniref:HTH_Tnp_Tc3_2 domain-containing protein n=1 Tax=Trichonephila clavipes TaxID=2585209 RepID=A0A8X6RCN2_TRICX|nr:HTH_Tnp_Tc3_2 domain-containing protein [Trichonephila clavipes]